MARICKVVVSNHLKSVEKSINTENERTPSQLFKHERASQGYAPFYLDEIKSLWAFAQSGFDGPFAAQRRSYGMRCGLMLSVGEAFNLELGRNG